MPFEKDSRLANNVCPECGCKLDAATFVADESIKPEPGDFSVCIDCGSFMVFDDDMRLEHFPDEKLLELEDKHRLELTKMRRAVMKIKERRDNE